MKLAAYLSHYALYALMIAVPLIGWAMLSAGGYPVVLSGRRTASADRAAKRQPAYDVCGSRMSASRCCSSR